MADTDSSAVKLALLHHAVMAIPYKWHFPTSWYHGDTIQMSLQWVLARLSFNRKSIYSNDLHFIYFKNIYTHRHRQVMGNWNSATNVDHHQKRCHSQIILPFFQQAPAYLIILQTVLCLLQSSCWHSRLQYGDLHRLHWLLPTVFKRKHQDTKSCDDNGTSRMLWW